MNSTPHMKAVVDTQTGKTEYVPLTPEEEAEYEKTQLEEAEKVRAQEEAQQARDAIRDQSLQLALRIRTGDATDQVRDDALCLLLETQAMLLEE